MNLGSQASRGYATASQVMRANSSNCDWISATEEKFLLPHTLLINKRYYPQQIPGLE